MLIKNRWRYSTLLSVSRVGWTRYPVQVLLLSAVLVATTNSCAKPYENGEAAAYCDAFETEAKAGQPDAQLQLAHCYQNGKGRPKDLDKAETLLRQSIQSGNVRALSSLGSLLMFERDSNAAEAVDLFKEAVDGGMVWSNFQLGIAYKNGYGIGPDERLASHHFQLSADADHPLSIIMLIAANKFGILGLQRSPSGADYWRDRLPRALRRSGIPSAEEYLSGLKNDEFVLAHLLSARQIDLLFEDFLPIE